MREKIKKQKILKRLKIDGVDVGLPTNKVMFSKAGYSFDDWVTKDLTFSERVILPESSILNQITERPHSLEVVENGFAKYYTFSYEANGKIMFSGTAILEEFNSNKEYVFQLIDSSFALFVNLSNKLNALSVDIYDFIFNTTSYTNLAQLSTSIWIWSVASMHENKQAAKVAPSTLAFSRPFFSVKRLVELMFSENNWTYSISENAALFEKMIISAKNEFAFTSYEKTFNEILIVSGSEFLDLTSPDFQKTDTITGTTTLNLNYNSKIRFRGRVVSDADMIFKITGSTVSGDNLTQLYAINAGTFDIDYTSNVFETENPTYNLTFEVVGNGTVDLSNLKLYTLIDENDFGNVSSANFTDFKVKTYDNLPDIIQKEVFKNCLVNVGGFFTTDNLRKKIKINSLNELSKLSAKDWSSKFIFNSESTEPLTNYGKINYFNYSNSTDVKPINLSRGVFTVANETLNEIKEVYTSIFEASQEVEVAGNTIIDNTIYDDIERINEVDTLLAYYENVSTYTVARFEKLTGTAVLQQYYVNFVNAVQKGIVIECKFNMNKTDFFEFDFTQLVYIEHFKSCFYVLKIGNYAEDELTTLTLLKS